jgi:hypothetical protein
MTQILLLACCSQEVPRRRGRFAASGFYRCLAHLLEPQLQSVLCVRSGVHERAPLSRPGTSRLPRLSRSGDPDPGAPWRVAIYAATSKPSCNSSAWGEVLHSPWLEALRRPSAPASSAQPTGTIAVYPLQGHRFHLRLSCCRCSYRARQTLPIGDFTFRRSMEYHLA